MIRPIKPRELRVIFEKICVNGGELLCLFFADKNSPEIASTKIVGKNDNPATWVDISFFYRRRCIAYCQIEKVERNNRTIMEEIYKKIANAVLKCRHSSPQKTEFTDEETKILRLINRQSIYANITQAINGLNVY